MKKSLFSFLTAIFLGSTLSLSAVDNLYIVGNAIGDGVGSNVCNWNGENAPLMYAEGNDVFSCTAYFTADKNFKFMETPTWGGQYYNGAGATGYLTVGTNGTLTKDGNGDYQFMMQESGWYKITCDLQNLTIKAEKKDNGDEQPLRYQALYLVGGAAPGEWNVEKGIRLENQGNSLYVGETFLSAGDFKLTVNQFLGLANEYSFFRDATDSGKVSRDATDDRKWSVPEAGYYTLTVDLSTSSISFVKNEECGLDLFVIGDATFGGWSTNDAPMMDKKGHVYTYYGYMKADAEFKFLTVREFSWSNHIQLINAAGETSTIQDSQATLKATFEVKNEGGSTTNDHKFKLAEAGNYKLTCDLNTLTLTVEKLPYQDSEIHYSALYMVGTATPDNEQSETFRDKAVKLVSNGDNTYTANDVALTTGVFKLLSACDLGWNTIHLHPTADDATKISTNATDDRKWSIETAGQYDITANLANMTISIVKQEEGPGTGLVLSETDGNVQISSHNGTIEVFMPGLSASSIDIMDLSGKVLYSMSGANDYLCLGHDMQQGLYIVRMNINGQVTAKKVMVK